MDGYEATIEDLVNSSGGVAITRAKPGLTDVCEEEELDWSGQGLTAEDVTRRIRSSGPLLHVKSLNLSRNRLTELPEAIQEFLFLRRLFVQVNRLTTLPTWLSKMQNLRHLGCELNNLCFVPNCLADMKLTMLCLSGNRDLPENIAVDVWSLDESQALVRRIKDANDARHKLRVNLLDAVYQGDQNAVKSLLEQRASPNETYQQGMTVLHMAAQKNSAVVARHLIRARALLDALYNGVTPLEVALKGRHLLVVRILLEGGASAQSMSIAKALSCIVDREGMTALHFVVTKSGALENIGPLLEAGIPLNAADSGGRTPIEVAALAHRIDCVKLLFEKGASLERSPNAAKLLAEEWGSLRHCIETGALLNVKAMVEAKPACADGKVTAFHFAVLRNRPDVIKVLSRAQDFIDKRDDKNRSPLFLAALNLREECALALWQGGARLDSALVESFQARLWNGALLLMKLGANPAAVAEQDENLLNSLDSQGIAALHAAVKQNGLSAIRDLILARANVNLTCSKGETPLDVAMAQNHQRNAMVLLLFKYGASLKNRPAALSAVMAVGTDEEGMTALHHAAFSGSLGNVVTILTANPSLINAKDRRGLSAIECAAKQGHGECVRALFVQGASLDNAPKAALMLANLGSYTVEGSPAERCLRGGESLANLKALIEAKPTIVDGRTQTLFHVAVERSLPELIENLSAAKAYVDACDAQGMSALTLAATLEKRACALALKECGANVEEALGQCLNRGTVAHLAAASFLLVELEADPSRFTELRLPENASLQELPYGLGRLMNLKKLDCGRGNPLSTIPLSVKEGGAPAITEYLRQLESGRVGWKKCKVLVLGKEGSGKTHLFRCMTQDAYKKNESTNGIDIRDFILNGTTELTWYDFAGQEVFYPTHEFFLTPQCVYLIVFNLNDDDYSRRLTHWLRVVSQYMRDRRRPTAALVVATHADELKKEKRDMVWSEVCALLASYPWVKGSLCVSCTQGDGLDEMRATLIDTIADAGLLALQVPVDYVKLHSWILRQRSNGESRMAFSAVAAAFPDMKVSHVEGGLRFLMDAGVCFFHPALDILILDPKVLADDFKQVISVFCGVKDGVVNRDGLRHTAWVGLDDRQIDENMELFAKLHIVFRKPKMDEWLVPSMLPEKAKLVVGPPKTFVSRSIRLFVLNVWKAGLMGHLMVRLQELPKLRLMSMWRTGVQFRLRHEVGEAILDFPAGAAAAAVTLTISTWTVASDEQGKGSQNLMQIVAKECASLLSAIFSKQFDESCYQEYIGCPHCLMMNAGGGAPTFLSKQDCIMWLCKDEKWVVCREDRVPMYILKGEMSFGELSVFRDEDLAVEAKPFAAGSYALVSRAKMRESGAEVVVKELNPTKAALFLNEKRIQAAWKDLQRMKEMLQGSPHDETLIAQVKQMEASLLAEGKQHIRESQKAAPPQTMRLAFEDFQHESLTMSKLNCPWVIQLIGIMVDPLRLVIEYCPSGDLLSALQGGAVWNGAKPSLSDPLVAVPRLCFKIAEDMACGMTFLHGQCPPIAHRDLRSPNIFLISLDPDAKVCAKIADFGLSVFMTSLQTKALSSWQWMAPEAQMGADYSHLCDLYSYAIVVNETFTQEIPFAEYETTRRPTDLFDALRTKGLRPSIPAFVPEWMRTIISEMWAQDPCSRPSFDQCRRILRRGGGGGGSGTWKRRSVGGLQGQKGAVLCMSYDGAGVVWMGTKDGAVLAFSLHGKELRKEKHGDARVQCIACIGPAVVLSGSSDGSHCFWTRQALARAARRSLPEAAAVGRLPEVTVLVVVTDGGLVLQCTSDGSVCALSSKRLEAISSTQLPGPIGCGALAPGKTCWIGVDRSIYGVRFDGVQWKVSQLGHGFLHDQRVTLIASSGYRNQMWTCTAGGQLVIWENDQKVRCVRNTVQGALCICGAEIRGRPIMCIGCNDGIQLWESITCSRSATLQLPFKGDVVSVVEVAPDVIWTSVRHTGKGKYTIYSWDFSEW